MSGRDILSPDSDSDSDLEGRKLRIAQMEQRYLNGQSLFIMSAAIKGEIQSNPWARKRKRAISRDHIGAYYPSKKVVHATEKRAAKSEDKLLDRKSVALESRESPSVPPIWDQLSAVAQREFAARPTARLIDFRQYDSQIPGQLREKPISVTKGVQTHTLDLHTISGNSPQITEAAHEGGRPAIATTDSVASRQKMIERRSSTPTYHPGPRNPSSPPSPESDNLAVATQYVREATQYVREPTEPLFIPVSSPILANETPGRTIRNSLARASLLSDANTDITPSPREEKMELVDEEVTSDIILNTQAELASAQNGLASALQFIVRDEPGSITLQGSKGQQPTQDTNLDLTYTAIGHCAQDTSASSKSPETTSAVTRAAIRNETMSRSPLPQLPTTPGRDEPQGLPSFGAFNSPEATTGSAFTFGSPLTFSPDQPILKGSSAFRENGTLDIQRYLQESTFDIDREALQQLEDEPLQLSP